VELSGILLLRYWLLVTYGLCRVVQMADAPLDWAERSLEELRSLPDHDTFCLMALSPLDGRYDRFVKELMPFFSEFGLIRYRVLIEVSDISDSSSSLQTRCLSIILIGGR
jgi:hypothetical protein